MIDSSYTPDEIVRRGKAVYERQIRSTIEHDHYGEFVVIDIETGKYEMDRDHLTAAKRARAKYPGAPLFAVRVGFSALARIGGRHVTRGP
jgi:hypothetical protein